MHVNTSWDQPVIDHMVIIATSLEYHRLFVLHRLKALCSVKPYTAPPLSAASHERTNHCHWALSARTDTWEWGEITKTCVGVAFGLFSFCRKERKKDLHVTLLNSNATEIKQSAAKNCLYSKLTPHALNSVLPCSSVWSIGNACKVHGATVPKGEIHSSVSYATTISMANTCKLRHRGNQVSLQLSSTFMPGWKRFQGVGAGRWMNEWKNPTSAAEFNLPLDSAPGLLICKVGTSAQVMLIWLQASAGIIRFSSLKGKCPGDEGRIGSVESPHQFCSANRAQDKIKKDGWLGASVSQRVATKDRLCVNPHLTPWGVSQLSSVCLSNPFILCLPSLLPIQQPQHCFVFNRTVFLIFSFQADLDQGCSLRSPFCSIQPLSLGCFLSLLMPSSGFSRGCKWQTSGAVLSSKRSCCYHLEINPCVNVCMVTQWVIKRLCPWGEGLCVWAAWKRRKNKRMQAEIWKTT